MDDCNVRIQNTSSTYRNALADEEAKPRPLGYPKSIRLRPMTD